MSQSEPRHRASFGFLSRQARTLLLGVFLVLIPVAFVAKHVEMAHKSLDGMVTKLSPAITVLGGIAEAILILLLLLVLCWVLGWGLGRTNLGRLWIAWEKAKLLPKSSPLLQEKAQKLSKAKTKIAPVPAHPALAHVEGGWQPGVIVEARADGWATVFVPTVPDLTSGRLFCLPGDRIRRLEMPVEAFRKQLMHNGHGTADWLSALAGPEAMSAEDPA